MPTWDIFCAVVDNYGDIGVTWRLARQLAAEYRLEVRLWVDDLRALQRLWPEVAVQAEQQVVAGVTVRRWQQPFAAVEPADVVIEAFACELPQSYIAAMAARARPPVWINLEYLSAEPWAADCHGLPSPQPRWGLQKYFFFPGFGADSGGLLRERELQHQRREFQSDPGRAAAFLAGLGVAAPPGGLTLSLFAYENAAVADLLGALAGSARPVLCLVPDGRVSAQVAGFFAVAALIPGGLYRRGALTVAALPFLRQDEYDRLLWSCAINFVRGEDSFVRAQWAGRPLIWQIYPQDKGAHWPKLDAFLALYTAALPAPAAAALTAGWRAWNGAGAIAAVWPQWEAQLPCLAAHAQSWADQQGENENLAARLVQFCANRV